MRDPGPPEHEDPLAPARGCLFGILFSVLIVMAVLFVLFVLAVRG
jgi:hypothetical protein